MDYVDHFSEIASYASTDFLREMSLCTIRAVSFQSDATVLHLLAAGQ